MNQIPTVLYENDDRRTWVIIGASRGIGLEFVRQLVDQGERIYATVRDAKASHASHLWGQVGGDHGRCNMMVCDVLSEASIANFVKELEGIQNLTVDYVVINAGVMRYPNRATEVSFDEFAFHLHTNTIGPIITAQRLLKSRIPIGTIVFMTSDSASASRFNEDEDGFAAYAASKAALNQMMRHMAAELKRLDDDTILLAMHPGDVQTNDPEPPVTNGNTSPTAPNGPMTSSGVSMSNGMGNGAVLAPPLAPPPAPSTTGGSSISGDEMQVDGLLSPAESVQGMLSVIKSKGLRHSGTWWTWENKPYPW